MCATHFECDSQSIIIQELYIRIDWGILCGSCFFFVFFFLKKVRNLYKE